MVKKYHSTAEQEAAWDAEEVKAAADLAAHKYKNDRQFTWIKKISKYFRNN